MSSTTVPYSRFAHCYDEYMDKQTLWLTKTIHKMIQQYHPQASTLLELACGTGLHLARLQQSYKVSGLDVSKKMLSFARKKVPRGRFYCQNMSGFSVNESFDVIICAFDSINHLLYIKDWRRTFNAAYRHLNRGGLLVFDCNTTHKLELEAASPPSIRKLSSGYLIMKTTKENWLFNYNLKIFKRIRGAQYLLEEENIKEKSLPLIKIKKMLKRFKRVKVIDPHNHAPSDQSLRLFFICMK